MALATQFLTGVTHVPTTENTVDALHVWPRPAYDTDGREALQAYVTHILRKGRISPTVLVCTLVLMTRGKALLSVQRIELSCKEWRRCHLFAAALVVAAKV